MSKNMAFLLARPEHLVSDAIQRLEELSGFQSIDIHMLAEINSKLRQKTDELGLDPSDTTGPELYYSLLSKYERDDHNLEKILNLDPHNYTYSIIKLAKHLLGEQNSFALKNSAAKRVLIENPPKKLMKLLHYRSIESMLKRERVGEIFSVLPYTESARWFKGFEKSLKELGPTDFENRQVEILELSAGRWKDLKRTNVVSEDLLTATVTIWPTGGDSESLSRTLTSIFKNVQSIQLAGNNLRLSQWSKLFFKQLQNIINNDFKKSPALIGPQQIAWKPLHNHLNKQVFDGDIFETSSENSKPISISGLLGKLNPDFTWWSGIEHVGRIQKNLPISLHLEDVSKNFEKKLIYKERNVQNLCSSLWDEVIKRYIVHPGVGNHILSQLNLIEPQPQEITVEENIQNEFNDLEVAKA